MGGAANMLSLETAKRLKELGLRWEPQEGDFLYYHTYGEESELGVINDSDMGENREESLDNIYTGEWIFAPRLDQLLAEIEGRGYEWDLHTFDGYYEIQIVCYFDGHKKKELTLMKGSPEEAAAQALVWILEQGGLT